MLFTTVYTFIGLSMLQNISYLTDWMGEVKVTLNVTTSEEESETSTSNEVKEVKEGLSTYQNKMALVQYNTVLENEYSNHKTLPEDAFIEVITPPPESIS